jgi:hypothetical protein
MALSSGGVRIDETASTTLETIPFFAVVFRLAAGFGIDLFVVTDRVVRDGDAPLFVERVFASVVFALPLVFTVVRDVEVLDREAAPFPDFVVLLFDAAVFDLDEDVVFGATPLAFNVVLDLEAVDFDFMEDDLAREDGEVFDLDEVLLALVTVRDLDVEDLEPDFDFADVFVAAIGSPFSKSLFLVLFDRE